MSDLDQESQKRVLPSRQDKQKLLESTTLWDYSDSEDDDSKLSKIYKRKKLEKDKPYIKPEPQSSTESSNDEDNISLESTGSRIHKTNKTRVEKDTPSIKSELNSDSESSNDDDSDEKLSFDHENKYKCSKCSNTYVTRGFLSLHMKTHVEGRLTCDICSQSFANGRNLKEHVTYMHTEDGKILYEKKKERKRLYSKGRPRPYLQFRSECNEKNIKKHSPSTIPCLKCGIVFKNQKALNTHIDDDCNQPEQVVQSKTNILCSVSGYVELFSIKEEWAKHVKSHMANKIPCRFCSSKYKNVATMRRHIRRVHDSEGREKAKLERIQYRKGLRARKRALIQPHKQKPLKKSSTSTPPEPRDIWDQPQLLVPARFEIIKVEPKTEPQDE